MDVPSDHVKPYGILILSHPYPNKAPFVHWKSYIIVLRFWSEPINFFYHFFLGYFHADTGIDNKVAYLTLASGFHMEDNGA